MNNVTTVDYSALTEPVDRTRVRDFKRAAKERGETWATIKGSQVLIVVGVVVFFFIFATFMSSVVSKLFSHSNAISDDGVRAIVPIAIGVIGVIGVGGWLYSASRKWARWYRLDQFATRNGFTAVPLAGDPAYAGAIYGLGRSRISSDHVIGGSERFFDIGNYQYTTGSGKNSKVHDWGVLAIKLDRRLPNMVLDAKSNNGLFGGTNLPHQFVKNQVLQLEGDFNKYFTLYCPREYERDALYIFTPDLMALLIDNAAAFDVEVVDDWMFVYSSLKLDSQSQAMWQRMFQIVHTVGSKTVSQSENYRDDRAVPVDTPAIAAFAASENRIAPQGQRLRKGVNWFSIAVVAAVAIAWFVFNVVLR